MAGTRNCAGCYEHDNQTENSATCCDRNRTARAPSAGALFDPRNIGAWLRKKPKAAECGALHTLCAVHCRKKPPQIIESELRLDCENRRAWVSSSGIAAHHSAVGEI